MLKYIENLGPADLERTVGFHNGRLDSGFLIVVLAENEIIRPTDFELKASTSSSGGKVACIAGDNINDILRSRGQDPATLKNKVADFFRRCRANYPAKVLPNLRHDESCSYPDAELLGPGRKCGVPQFYLNESSGGKNFVVLKEVR